MAEGGQSPIVYHFENVETLNVIHEQNVASIERSSVGSITIGSTTGEQRDEAIAENNENGRMETDQIRDPEHKDKEPGMNDADIIWLQNGKFGLYTKRPLHTEEKVYLGIQKVMSSTRRDVAIKRIVYQDRKRKEVDLLLRLQHPNIVQVIDAFDHRGEFHCIYIVMELCSQNLQEYIDENKLKPRDFRMLFSFSKQLVAGLAYLHENNIVHRDLKPQNVLVSMCKNFLKLTDFGMSKEIQRRRFMATVTNIGVGSEGYRSPETYQLGTHISPRLDIFPLGLILHLLFSNGLHPFGSDPYDWSDNIRKNKNLDLSQIPEFEEPSAPKKRQLLELLDRMLRHIPRDRPTADEVKNDCFFKDLIQEGGKVIDEQVAALDISSPNTVAPEREASEDSRSLQEVEIENPSEAAKRIKELEERGSQLMDMGAFRNATKVLLELYNREETDKFEVALKITECELHLQRGREQDSIRHATDLVRNSRTPSAAELLEMADKSLENKKHFRSLILLHITRDLYKTEVAYPDKEVEWIASLVYKITKSSKSLIEAGGVSREIGIRYGVEYMERLLDELRSVENVSPGVRAAKEAGCLVDITYICIFESEYRRSIDFGINGVKILEHQFGADASKYRQYGKLLNNVGAAYEKSGENLLAEKYFVDALKAYNKAEDLIEDERKKEVDRTTNSLGRIRRKINDSKEN